jgi:division/cell wall cluster transcriptional repressor MraZ
MAMGALLVLFGIVLACKLRDSGRVMAQSEPPVAAPADTVPPLAPVPDESGKQPAKITVEESARTLPPIVTTIRSAPPLPPKGEEIKRTGFETSAPPPPETGAPSPPDIVAGTPRSPASPPPIPVEPPPMKASAPPPPSLPPGGGPVSPPPSSSESLLPPPSIPPSAPTPPSAPKSPEGKPTTPSIPIKVEAKDAIDEPPLAPAPGPIVNYHVTTSGETFKTLAKKTLGTVERWTDIHKLNPSLKADAVLPVGTTVRLPGDACVAEDDTVKPLPALRARTAARVKPTLPLTGTYPVALDDKKVLTLPQAILKQLGSCETVMVSPGSDKCLWLTNQAHLDRLAQKLEKSPARESDKSGFKRLYYAQTMKVPVKDGQVAIAEKLAAFAGLNQQVVLVGIDDHFEVWDATRWRRYTQAKKAAPIEE